MPVSSEKQLPIVLAREWEITGPTTQKGLSRLRLSPYVQMVPGTRIELVQR